MMKKIELKAKTRSKEDKNTKLIKDIGNIPAVLYGNAIENKNLIIKLLDFENIYNEAGESSLVNLIIDDKDAIKIIIKEIQKDPIKDKIIHTDLYKIDMNKTITTEIPIKFVGVSPAVNELGGFLVKHFNGIDVECLPGDLVNNLEVNISSLVEFGNSIKIKDIKIPDNIKLLGEMNDLIVSVLEPRKEIEKSIEEEAEKNKDDDKKEVEGEPDETKDEKDKDDKKDKKKIDKK